MKRILNNLNQEVFDFFTATTEWPEGYSDNLSSVGGTLLDNIYGMDIETEGLNPYDHKTRIISVACSPESNVAMSTYCLNEWDKFDFKLFKELLENPNIILVGHNIKYDINWIRIKLGIDVKCMLFDTMFAQYLIDENIESNSLGALAEQFEDLKGYKATVNRNNLKMVAKDDVLIYNCKDADASRRLYDAFLPKLKKNGYDKLMTTASMVLPILSKMETRGIYLDKEYASKTQIKLFNRMVELRYAMAELTNTPFDPDSPKSLGQILYKNLEFTVTKYTPSGQPSTDSEAISYLSEQCRNATQKTFINSISEYKKQVKLITTYYQPIERWTQYDGRVHTNYSLGKQRNEESSGGTVTGRLSSNNPNLQNIPRGKEHRGMFAATDGYTYLDGDFSQLELRVAAYLSQEPAMMDAFNNGLDIHTTTMSLLSGKSYEEITNLLADNTADVYDEWKNYRTICKNINFGILYGIAAHRLQRQLRSINVDYDLDTCNQMIKKWLAKYPMINKWIKQQKLQAVNLGYVSHPLGQRRRLPDADFDTPEGQRALRQATNFPVQSMASWICLIGLIILDQYFKDHPEVDGHILLQVHDSVTSEVKLFNNSGNQTDIERIKEDISRIMEVETLAYIKDVFDVDFNVPLQFKVNIQERWS